MTHKLYDRFLIVRANYNQRTLLSKYVHFQKIFQDHLEKQDDSSKWKNIPEEELMSYVEEIEDDIIFYPEEAPGVFLNLEHWIIR